MADVISFVRLWCSSKPSSHIRISCICCAPIWQNKSVFECYSGTVFTTMFICCKLQIHAPLVTNQSSWHCLVKCSPPWKHWRRGFWDACVGSLHMQTHKGIHRLSFFKLLLLFHVFSLHTQLHLHTLLYLYTPTNMFKSSLSFLVSFHLFLLQSLHVTHSHTHTQTHTTPSAAGHW